MTAPLQSFNSLIENKYEENHLRFPLILQYYRIIGITFGGLSVGSNGELKTNNYMKVFGYIYALIVTTFTFVGISFISTLEDVTDIRNSGLNFIYYLIMMSFFCYITAAMSNLWFLQHHGMKLLIIIRKYQSFNKKRMWLFHIVWFGHILLIMFLFIYESIFMNISATDIAINFYMKFYLYPTLWATSMFTWFISILVKEYLV